MLKPVPFQTIQFSISTQSTFILSIDRTLSGATTPGQSGPGSDGNDGVLRIPQSSSITRASSSDYLVSYLGHSLGESYPSAEMGSNVLYVLLNALLERRKESNNVNTKRKDLNQQIHYRDVVL